MTEVAHIIGWSALAFLVGAVYGRYDMARELLELGLLEQYRKLRK